MSADRNLLELAAKACGYDTSHPWNAERLEMEPPIIALWVRGGSTGWDPLDDDGDALRLAVFLHIRIDIHALEVWVTNQRGHTVSEVVSANLRAATRRAIVRAAAEIERLKEDWFDHVAGYNLTIDDLRTENQKLRDALKEYGRAGVGNSTDWRIQISALQMATEALRETK